MNLEADGIKENDKEKRRMERVVQEKDLVEKYEEKKN
jgi:hypothetical protein